jgi:parallel beta-helix repeat protein
VSFDDTEAHPNIITHNAAQGIVLRRGASAVITGNEISNNTGNGVRVTESSYTRLSANSVP